MLGLTTGSVGLSSICFQSPQIFGAVPVMLEHINLAVLRQDPKVVGVRAVPLVTDFGDFQTAPPPGKTVAGAGQPYGLNNSRRGFSWIRDGLRCGWQSPTREPSRQILSHSVQRRFVCCERLGRTIRALERALESQQLRFLAGSFASPSTLYPNSRSKVARLPGEVKRKSG